MQVLIEAVTLDGQNRLISRVFKQTERGKNDDL